MRTLTYALGGAVAAVFSYLAIRTIRRRNRDHWYVSDATLQRLRREGL